MVDVRDSLLYATINATNEGLLAIYSNGSNTLLNQRFIEMWGITEDIINLKDDEQKILFIVNQVKNSEAFLTKIQEIEKTPTISTNDVIELKDGRVFEMQTQPQYVNQEVIGRVWNFYDITARVELEKNLRSQNEKGRLIAKIAQKIRQSLKKNDILNNTVSEVRNFLNTDRVLIFEPNSDSYGVIIAESVIDPNLAILHLKISDPCFGEKLIEEYKQGRITFIEDIYHSDLTLCHLEFLSSLKVVSNLVVPIVHENRLWGLLIAHDCQSNRQWEILDIELLQFLTTQVSIALTQAELFHELEVANQELHYLASIDSLTQLANRRRFEEFFEREWQRMSREKQPLSIILCDVDYFKLYNDNYGHQAGDSCLQQIAVVLSQSIRRPADTVARYGGEEFIIILPNTDTNGAIYIGEKIRKNVENLQLNHNYSPISDYVTISIGVSTIIPTKEIVLREIIKSADQGLYKAKAKGRNCVFFQKIENN